VKVHDFVDAELGKVVPYGVYDIAANAGCVSVGIDNDTAQFAVNSIRRWQDLMGRERYPGAGEVMITADGGGSNRSRVRLFAYSNEGGHRFRFDGGHHSALMAAMLVSSRRPVLVMS
jgi:hypothetical protein